MNENKDKYTLGPDCNSSCLDQGMRVCGHEFSIKHHYGQCPKCAGDHHETWCPENNEGSVETAWLIERGISYAPSYLSICNGHWKWTKDHNEALRFARKIDAERAATTCSLKVDRIAEHSWSSEGAEEDQENPSWAELGAMNEELQQLREFLAAEREKYQRLSDSETEQWEAYGAKLTNALKNALNKLDTVVFDERSILAEVRKILRDALQ
jgi:hypothetical protein